MSSIGWSVRRCQKINTANVDLIVDCHTNHNRRRKKNVPPIKATSTLTISSQTILFWFPYRFISFQLTCDTFQCRMGYTHTHTNTQVTHVVTILSEWRTRISTYIHRWLVNGATVDGKRHKMIEWTSTQLKCHQTKYSHAHQDDMEEKIQQNFWAVRGNKLYAKHWLLRKWCMASNGYSNDTQNYDFHFEIYFRFTHIDSGLFGFNFLMFWHALHWKQKWHTHPGR